MVKRMNKSNPLVEFIMDNRDYVLEVAMTTGEKVIIYPNVLVYDLDEYINVIDEDTGIQAIIKVDNIVKVQCGG